MSVEGSAFLFLLREKTRLKTANVNSIHELWDSAKAWTEFMVGSVKTRSTGNFGIVGSIGSQIGYKLQAEYLRVDQIWYYSPSDDPNDWEIDAFIEHENDSRLLQETIRKLLQLGPGLKVVITYPDQSRVNEIVKKISTFIHERYGTSRNSRLLVVFGFFSEGAIHWQGYEFDGFGRRSQIPSNQSTDP